MSALLLLLFLHNNKTYHHARGHRYTPATVGVRNDVSVADAEEGDGYQPHRVQQVGVFLVVVPAHHRQSVSVEPTTSSLTNWES